MSHITLTQKDFWGIPAPIGIENWHFDSRSDIQACAGFLAHGPIKNLDRSYGSGMLVTKTNGGFFRVEGGVISSLGSATVHGEPAKFLRLFTDGEMR